MVTTERYVLVKKPVEEDLINPVDYLNFKDTTEKIMRWVREGIDPPPRI